MIFSFLLLCFWFIRNYALDSGSTMEEVLLHYHLETKGRAHFSLSCVTFGLREIGTFSKNFITIFCLLSSTRQTVSLYVSMTKKLYNFSFWFLFFFSAPFEGFFFLFLWVFVHLFLSFKLGFHFSFKIRSSPRSSVCQKK